MKKRKNTDNLPGWSHIVDADSVSVAAPVEYRVEAGAEQRKALAERLGLPAVDGVSADITIRRSDSNKAVVHVEGVLKADVTQNCVITGEAIHSHMLEEFEAWFTDKDQYVSLSKARHERMGKAIDAEIPMMEESEDPEPMLPGGKIDLGDLVTQYLSLGLDPYPQKEGAVLQSTPGIGIQQDGATRPSPLRRNPFEALKALKGRGGDGEGD